MLSRIAHELVVVSDVHLVSDGEQRGKLLLDLLSRIDTTQVRYLVLLGDIFDFCFGASKYFQEKFAVFGVELSRLAKKNIKVFFVEGNHEFLIHKLSWPGVEFIKGKNLRIDIPNGPSFVFTHGDSINAPWHYRLYSEAIRSELSRLCALQVPQKMLDKLALAISAKSRKRNYTRSIPHKDIVAKISHWLIKQDADYGVVGHFHVPYDAKIPNEKGRIFCLESWDKPNCFSYDKGKFHRIYLKDGDLKIVTLDS